MFPKHHSLHITHNQHKDYYMSAQDYFNDYPHLNDIDSDIRHRCIQQDSIWEIQWYPNTPISFYIVVAPTFEEAIKISISLKV